MPPKLMDKYQKMLYAEHIQIPEFASSCDEFVEMWDDASYGDHDKLSIYYSVLLVTLRKVNAILEQVEHEPILLEMALVRFLSVWLEWGTGSAVLPGKFSRGPTKKKETDPTDIAMFGANAVFLRSCRSITAIKDDQAIEFMTAVGLSIASVGTVLEYLVPSAHPAIDIYSCTSSTRKMGIDRCYLKYTAGCVQLYTHICVHIPDCTAVCTQ
jgi:hypothetical protein